MAGKLSTAGTAGGERTRKQIRGELELTEQRKFALAEAGSLGTFGLRLHLEVTILQELPKSQGKKRTRK
jgi:hypothetical protein